MKRFLSAAVSMWALCILSACGGGASSTPGGGGGGTQIATHFTVTAPATAFAGTPFSITVVALDASNQTVASYSGTLHLTSSDAQAVLSADSTLTNGTESFATTLASAGSQTITATDTVTATITGSSGLIEVSTNLNAFHATGDMGTEREAHTATLLPDGKVLITGGFNLSGVLATAELFDPTTGAFTPTGAMTTSRFAHTATLLDHGPAATNGKVLITGGTQSGDIAESLFDLATAELYDPATGTFTATGAMSQVRSEHTATLLSNGKVLIAGGTADNVAELYDPATGSFTSTSGMLIVGGRWGCTATLLNDGTVLIAGGRDDENIFDAFPLNDAELFNPTTGTFTATGAMNQFRYDHTANLLESGQVLMAGGFNGVPVPDAELFDPSTGSFSRTGSMGSPRAQHTATLLNDGTVLVAGSFSGIAPLASAEVFDPTTGTFAPTGSMEAPRYTHTATLLNSGEVLVTGGSPDLLLTALSSAELYIK
jgi:WD40 repeat protein